MPTKKKSEAFANRERGDIARKKLIEAGLIIFSEVGYKGASTRRLAATAGVNIAAIPYYFGSKEGLYLAMIDHIVEYYKKSLGSGLVQIRQALNSKNSTFAGCCSLLDEYMCLLVTFVLQESNECSQISRIYTREQLDPTSAFERLYDGFFRDMRETLAALVAAILGLDVLSTEVKLITETLLGQVAIFKSSRVTVLHNMGWKNYEGKSMADIERIVRFNVNALMQAYQKKDAVL
jgi:TetR/AcrR family transcriptional regulator, regulator of cefoperazone and chloramphenicol sensitivity